MVDGDCGKGGTCAGAFPGVMGVLAPTPGTCLAQCLHADDCREGYRCVNGLGLPLAANGGTGSPDGGLASLLGPNTCQPKPETDKLPDGVVGSACSADSDCTPGSCAQMLGLTRYPGGYCTGRCLEDADCGSSGICNAGLPGSSGSCSKICGSDADCGREGYRCRSSGTALQCVPGAAPLPDGVIGAACAGDEDCGAAAMSCMMRIGRYAAEGGYCSLRCVDDTDCGGGVCVGGGFGAATGTCYKRCESASDCREGYTCGRAGATGAQLTVCTSAPPDMDAGVP
jgi:hypothetical protein